MRTSAARTVSRLMCWPLVAGMGEYVALMAGQWVQIAQNCHGLSGQGYDVPPVHLHTFAGYAPLSGVKIELSPFSPGQLSRPEKYQRRKFQGCTDNRQADITIQCAQ